MNQRSISMNLGIFLIGGGLAGIFYNTLTTKATMELFMISHLGFITAIICGSYLLYESERKERKVEK